MEQTTLHKIKTWVFTNFTNKVLWGVYISLLMVLYPHTVWAFSVFEPATTGGIITSRGAAFAFEAIVAVLVHKLADHWAIVSRKKFKAQTEGELAWLKFSHKYLNAYVLGLVAALVVSVAANTAHAVQYGDDQSLRIVSEWGVPFWIYTTIFGAMLPFCSILFAKVLSDANDLDNLFNDGVQDADTIIKEMQTKFTHLQTKFTAMKTKYEQEIVAYQQKIDSSSHAVNADKQRVAEMEQTINQLKQQVNSLGAYSKLLSDDAATRVNTAKQLWPELSNRALASVCDCSPTYVGRVLGEN